jgi:uncharacterized protein (DUF983 family)
MDLSGTPSSEPKGRGGQCIACATNALWKAECKQGRKEQMNEDSAHFPPVDPVKAGIKGLCPRCGQGKLFDGFLKMKPACASCGLDYTFADSGDGPVVFVILIVGFIVVGAALWMEVNVNPPLWLHFLLWIPVASIFSLVLMRILKGILINLQFRNNARQGEIDRD